ncbi:hypothetical protein [Breoghania sp.]|uniref:hypothetical protein n=1 Tax=Breoghania sp. TaxID=2065378 RepID=UPI002AAB4178|nr:hypothetical protein [Breoghania sp.]
MLRRTVLARLAARPLAMAALVICVAGPALLQGGTVNAAEKRPYADHRPRFEIGIGYAHRPGAIHSAPEVSIPFRRESFFSDSVDLVFEGWAGYSRHTGLDAFGLQIAPGFSYWLDSTTRITPQVRLGFDYLTDLTAFQASGKTVLIAGADVRAEQFASLHPDRPYERQDFLIPGLKLGGLSRIDPTGSDYSYLMAGASLAYERGIPLADDAPFHFRAKLMAESEMQMNTEGTLDIYTTGLLELRAVRPDGRLIAKGEIGVTSDFGDYNRISVTFARGF